MSSYGYAINESQPSFKRMLQEITTTREGHCVSSFNNINLQHSFTTSKTLHAIQKFANKALKKKSLIPFVFNKYNIYMHKEFFFLIIKYLHKLMKQTIDIN